MPQRLQGLMLQIEHLPGIAIEDIAGLGNPDFPAKPVDQVLPGFLLQGADMLTDGRLGQKHGLGGPGKTFEFNHLAISGQFMQIHDVSFFFLRQNR